VIQAARHLQRPLSRHAAEHRLADVEQVVVLVLVNLEVFAVGQVDLFRILAAVFETISMPCSSINETCTSVSLCTTPFSTVLARSKLSGRFLELVFDEARDLVDLMDGLDRMLLERG
jgi:hypothetical protein